MDKNFDTEIEDRSDARKKSVQERLGKMGRALKKIDLRTPIVAYPFTAVGIAVAAGAIVGMVRAKPQRGRFTGALISTLGVIGYRLVRDTAVRELGQYAKDFFMGRDAEADLDARPVDESDSGIRYAPAH